MKEFLSQRQLSFHEYNIVEDRNAFEEMWQLSGQKGAPVVAVDNRIVVGFQKEKLEELLESLS